MIERSLEPALPNIESLSKETINREPMVELVGTVKSLSLKKAWFRDRTPRPDVGPSVV